MRIIETRIQVKSFFAQHSLFNLSNNISCPASWHIVDPDYLQHDIVW